ncbi:venom protease-like [Contarinia nasturtii]|uniref:venom protease-like n=1 Tax=Contarinia nasturtii TaxID=265458 RepID=UPI0012D38AC6|nr:venom protease-like [Contarinia nasturtii]
MAEMLRLWAFCILFTLTTAATLNKAPVFNKVNEEPMVRNAFPSTFTVMPRIANGNRAEVGVFPWHAFLIIKYRTNKPEDPPTFCSGAILNEEWIISTAECLSNAVTVRVDVGSVNINTPSRSVYPYSSTLHPDYNNTNGLFKNNIALLRLSGENMLNFDGVNGEYAPVRLPNKRQINETFVGYESYFTGFGYPSQNSKNISEYLLFAEQMIIRNIECQGFYGNNLELISDNVICSLSVNLRQGICFRDNGGPLVVNEYGTNTLVAVLSFVHKTGNCGKEASPAVYTRITKYFEWISNITKYQIRP